MSGRVILVGAGPGDPDLITVRGRRALARADVVVYDALASEQLLELAPPGAGRINVGKRGHDAPTRPQPETSELLVRLAREGKTVVRLKGGDPFVFGRGGEEASACAEAGVPFEIVPGVSAAIGALAYAGIPVTDRRHGASFAVVTGHKDPTQVTRDTRWDALATATDTLVILMGMRNLPEIVGKLLEAGRAPDTPAAVVMLGTLPAQRVVEAPLAGLVAAAAEARLGAPAAVVVGDVVKLRATLAWYEKLPLFGARVLVTRPAEQAGPWVEALRDAGAQAVVLPMIEIAPPETWGELDAALAALDRFDALVFTSANGVRHFAERAAVRGVPLARSGLAVACVGPRTAAAAARAGLAVQVVPKRRDAEGLREALEKELPPRGRRFLWPRGAAARDTLARGVREAGGEVEAVTAYRTLPARIDPERLRAPLREGAFDALTFASPSAVRGFAALLDDEAREAARRCCIAAIGPVTAEALRTLSLPPDVAPARAGAAELVAELAVRLAERRRGGAR